VPTEEEIKKIIELYDNGNGLSQGQIAKELGRSKSTINEWLHKILKSEQFANGPEQKKAQTANATAACIAYGRERRLALNDKLFARLEEFLGGPVTPKDYKDLMISYGILEDKRKNLEPLQTDSTKSGLAEMREAIHEERKNGMETPTEVVQSG
jgi:transcriptional regulator with XRE-family HTH domain